MNTNFIKTFLKNDIDKIILDSIQKNKELRLDYTDKYSSPTNLNWKYQPIYIKNIEPKLIKKEIDSFINSKSNYFIKLTVVDLQTKNTKLYLLNTPFVL